MASQSSYPATRTSSAAAALVTQIGSAPGFRVSEYPAAAMSSPAMTSKRPRPGSASQAHQTPPTAAMTTPEPASAHTRTVLVGGSSGVVVMSSDDKALSDASRCSSGTQALLAASAHAADRWIVVSSISLVQGVAPG